MQTDLKKKRVIFLDLLRVFAVVNMIQGHTLDVILSNVHRTTESVAYNIWHFNRGITAPVFLFTSGAIFSYIFLRNSPKFSNNPRVKIGIKRALLLLFIGYFLKIPNKHFLSFDEKTYNELSLFFAVDVLQLIGIGLLLIMLLFYIQEKFRLNKILVFIISAIFITLFTPIAERVKWIEFTPLFIASYFYNFTGSLFPLFPFVLYMLFGAAFGVFLSQNINYCNTKKFSLSLLILGALFILAYLLLYEIRLTLGGNFGMLSMLGNLSYLRTGIVLIFVALITIISKNVAELHWSINLLARNSLSIYIVHLFILYGSTWNKGIIYYFGRSISATDSIKYCIFFIIFLTLFAYAYEMILKKIKSGFQRLQTAFSLFFL
ncbi:MAG: heparan-alpha-glucosaminide N-acetyltransferase domain-containing protein [Thermodesulfobacteriota bacterium]